MEVTSMVHAAFFLIDGLLGPNAKTYGVSPKRQNLWRLAFVTSAPCGQVWARTKRRGPWRLPCEPDAKDVGVTKKGQKRNSFQNRVKS